MSSQTKKIYVSIRRPRNVSMSQSIVGQWLKLGLSLHPKTDSIIGLVVRQYIVQLPIPDWSWAKGLWTSHYRVRSLRTSKYSCLTRFHFSEFEIIHEKKMTNVVNKTICWFIWSKSRVCKSCVDGLSLALAEVFVVLTVRELCNVGFYYCRVPS